MPEPRPATEQRVRFLVVGMARSGTTVVQRLLCEIPGVWVPGETHFWRHAGAIAGRFPVPLSRSDAGDALAWFASLESSSGFDLDVEAAVQLLGAESFLWDLFTAIVKSMSPAEALCLGEKTPDHSRWIFQLLRAIPDLRVIGLIRDPREVFRSHLGVPWGMKEPWSFTEKWVEHARILDDAQRLWPGRVAVFRYEDVVHDPESFRSQAAQLLGVADQPAEIEATVIGRGQLFPPKEWWKASALDPIVPLAGRWDEEVDELSISVIESRSEIEMEHWGYAPTGFSSVSADRVSDTLYKIRTDGHRAAAISLPITRAQFEAWQQTDTHRVKSWKQRAEQVASEKAASERAAGKAREDAGRLTKISADLTDRNKRLESQVESLVRDRDELRLSSASWRERAEELNSETKLMRRKIAGEKERRLRAERERLLAVGKMKRLQSRRWWRLGSALGRWRRAPLRLDVLFRDLWTLATTREPLPPMPDVHDIDVRLDQLRSADQSQGHEPEFAAAKEALDSGMYEDCLAVLDGLPAEVRGSSRTQLLYRDCYIRLGEVSAALSSVRRALAERDDQKLRNQARVLEGRLRETDPNWTPTVGTKPVSAFRSQPGSVLHVLKESLPFFERGYTMRSHMSLLAQKMAGFDPTVVTSLGFPRNQGFEGFAPVDVIDGIAHHRLDLGPRYVTKRVPYDQILSDQATLTARLCREIRPSIIQAGSGYRGYETALVGLAVAEHLSVPMIYEIRSFLEHTWTPEFDRSEEGEYYRRRHDQETRCLQQADLVITIAEAMREEIIGRGVPADKVAVVPNVVDIDRFRPRPKPARLAARYGIEKSPVLGYISNLGAREGIDNLVRAVKHLRDQGNPVTGLVVGDGPERQALEDLVKELGLERSFVLTGHIPNTQIEDHYALIDLFVIPRVDDRAARLVTPLKPLEAMAMEIPVIAADLPALRELVAPGERGEVFESGDPEALAETALDILESKARLEEFVANAKDWVARDRTLESNAHRYQQILNTLLS